MSLALDCLSDQRSSAEASFNRDSSAYSFWMFAKAKSAFTRLTFTLKLISIHELTTCVREATDIGDFGYPIISTAAITLQIARVVTREAHRSGSRASVLIVEEDDVFYARKCDFGGVGPPSHVEQCFIGLNHNLLK